MRLTRLIEGATIEPEDIDRLKAGQHHPTIEPEDIDRLKGRSPRKRREPYDIPCHLETRDGVSKEIRDAQEGRLTEARQKYNARWYSPSLSKLADISFEAASDEAALRTTRSEGRKLGYSNASFELYQGSRHVHSGT